MWASNSSLWLLAFVCLAFGITSLFVNPFATSALSPSSYISCPGELEDVGKDVRLADFGPQLANAPPIYLITPTHNYLGQTPHLVRLLWQFSVIPRIIWIIIEDATKPAPHIKQMLIEELQALRRANPAVGQNLQVVYRAVTTPGAPRNCRGMLARNAGLEVVFKLVDEQPEGSNKTDNGWVYFADDDNSYSPQLFEEIRKINTVGVWPVGNMGKYLLSSPILDSNGTVREFYDPWMKRKYPMDMAGFGFNIDFMKKKAADSSKTAVEYWKWAQCNPGAMESVIIDKAISTLADLQPLAMNCTKIYVWHTRTTTGPIAQAPFKWLRGKSKASINAPTLLKEFSHVPRLAPKAPYWH